VAIPTETVYGLGANALDARAVARIYEVKGRPSSSPLIVHVASVEMARDLVTEWPEAAGLLAARYWPGPLTMVLPKAQVAPDIVTAGLPTVGLRMPAHPVALELIRRAGVPIAAPSANRFTEVSPTTAEHVRRSLGGAIDMIVDGGACEVGIESAVISLAGAPALLRPGMLKREDMEAVLGQPVAVAGVQGEGAHPSPGMHERHYSPRTPVVVVCGALPPGRGAYLWRRRSLNAELKISMPDDPGEYARRLYGALHQADAAGLEWIAVEALPDTPEWAGIADRVGRAVAR
jgi:L-threonylcarbamoyladenylate synthase